MREIDHPSRLKALAGQELAVSDWVVVDQAMVNAFAAATGDDQWIHTDVERARSGPFGNTIAHGYLTLSLLSRLFGETVHIAGARMHVNYGVNRARFPAPVPTGSRVRARFALVEAAEVDGGAIQSVWRATVEREGGDKPVCVADTVMRSFP